MKKLFIILAVIALAVVGYFCLGQENKVESANEKPIIKIGASLPLTGNLAMYGQALQKVLDLSLKDASEQNLKYDYKIVIEDDAFEIKKALANLNRFKSINNINAVMSFWGNIGIVTSEWTEKNKIIHIGCALSDKIGIGYYNFTHATQPKTFHNRMLKFYKDNGFKRIGITYVQSLEIQELVDNLVFALQQNGFEVAFITSFNPSERNIRTEALKMKETKPDVVTVLLQTPLINIFGKTVKELDFNVPIFGINSMVDAIEEYEGQTYITEDSGSSDFTKHFESSTGIKQTACVVNFYDGLKMLINAYEKTPVKDGASIPNNEDVVKTLLDLDNNGFKSVIDNISIDIEGNVDSPAVLKRIINGESVTVEK